MLLEHKVAVIYGGAGSVGSAVARAFAREGAKAFLAGRTLATLDKVAEQIRAAGSVAETAQVDTLDEQAVDQHDDAMADKAGGIDISFNDDVQGRPLAALPFEQFARPITKAMRNRFLTARAVARHMTRRGSGVILTITGGDREAIPTLGGTLVAWAGMQVKTLRGVRTVASFGPKIQRAVQPRPDGLLFHQLFVFGLLPLHVGIRQYWRDFDALERWVRTEPHRSWWRELLRGGSRTAFWHETYFMRGGMEAIFLDLERPTGLLAFAPGAGGAGRDVLCAAAPAAGGRGAGPTRALRTGVLWLKRKQTCAPMTAARPGLGRLGPEHRAACTSVHFR
jgi:3-oxoacyl-[acyl-carrier protein] reductase